MAIVVKHDQPGSVAALGGLATAIGEGQSATRQADRGEDHARFLLGLRERRREYDINTALRVRASDIEQRQYNTSLAMQDSRQQALNQNSYLNRQAQLESQAMREESDIFQQQQAQQFQFAAQSAKTLDEQVFETEKAAQQLKLNPEGQRIRNEKIGSLRAIREKTAFARPEVRASIYSQWLADYNQSNLAAYEEQPPSREEWYQSTTYKDEFGNVIGEDRSGKPRVLVEAPPPVLTPQEWAAHTYTAPDGSSYFMHPRINSGKPMPLNDAKPEKKEAAAKPVDTSKYLKEAASQLRAEHQISQTGSESPSPYKSNLNDVKARAREIMAAEKELEAELAGADLNDDSPSDGPLLKGTPDLFNAKRPQTMEEVAAVQPGEVFLWNGQYAEMNDDGTVTVIE